MGKSSLREMGTGISSLFKMMSWSRKSMGIIHFTSLPGSQDQSLVLGLLQEVDGSLFLSQVSCIAFLHYIHQLNSHSEQAWMLLVMQINIEQQLLILPLVPALSRKAPILPKQIQKRQKGVFKNLNQVMQNNIM